MFYHKKQDLLGYLKIFENFSLKISSSNWFDLAKVFLYIVFWYEKTFSCYLFIRSRSRKSWNEIFRKKNRRMKARIKKVVLHAMFYWLVITCVFLNTVSVAAEYYMQPKWLTDLQGNSKAIRCLKYIWDIFKSS